MADQKHNLGEKSADVGVPATGSAGIDHAELLDFSPDGLVVTESDGTIVLVNRGVESMFGYRRQELIGKPVEILVPDRLRGPHTAHRTRFRADPVSRPMGSGLELRARRRDGTEFPVEISLSPIGRGDNVRFFAAVRDVTDRVAVEAENDAIRHVIDSAHDALYMFDPDSLRLSYANQGLIAQLGYDGDELLTMTPPHFMPDVSRAAFVAELQAVITGDAPSLQINTVHRGRDGADIPVDVVINFPRPARSDQPRRLVALARDVSRRQRIERERDHGMRWLEALARVRSTLLSEPSLDGALTLIADQVRGLTAADVVLIAEPDVAADATPTEQASPSTVSTLYRSVADNHVALAESSPPESALVVDQAVGEVLRGGTVVASRSADVGRPDLWNQPLAEPFDHLMLLPIERRGTIHGLLLAGRIGPEPFSDGQVAVATSLADEAAKAYTLVDARRAKVHLRLLEDRERLGRDLHDLIIQRIFAAGLRLQSAQGLVDDPDVRERIADAVSQLDETIAELRNTIFQLSVPIDLVVADRLQTVVDDSARHLSVRPELIITGDPSRIPEPVLLELEPALTEMLANVWRHAGASRVEVTVQVGRHDVQVSVSDDGRGFDPDLVERGNGLDNLGHRARRVGGTWRIDSTPDRGTTAHWTAALPPA